MARSSMWAIALLAVACLASQASAQGVIQRNTTLSQSTSITSKDYNATQTVFIQTFERLAIPAVTPTAPPVILPLVSVVPCGVCPTAFTCCHVGNAFRFTYQCLPIAVPAISVTVAPCKTCAKPTKPAPAPKAPVVVSSYCKCGSGTACCQIGKTYKCVTVYKPKPVKCGKKTCGAGSGCKSSGKWWKRRTCTKVHYTFYKKW